MDIKPVHDLRSIADWKQKYLETLVGPLDGYWETAIIGLAPHFEMVVDDHRVGYFVEKNGCLLQFYVENPFLRDASAFFEHIILEQRVCCASVSTVESIYLSLCLDRQTAVSINTYLFHNDHPVQLSLPAFPNAQFRPGTLTDLQKLVQFYQENNEYEDTEAIETGGGGHDAFTRSLIENEQVFLLVDHHVILGVGECRISETQKPFADIGMITNNQTRRRGIGAFLLAQLKEYCYSQSVKPICSCTFDNISSRKTIEKAGFIAQHRILDITLQ